ncbi:MAG: hypothetical protein KGR98_06575 [Verrucomicrobia bacterium]|nr:hypothetical protein [Verrucomicrobiota bacterium]MDE3099924.1 hypothetical protein [Verrucomicrobiota bacterium]
MALLALIVCPSVFGQIVANDLYMGFQNQAAGGANDYIINLGLASSAITNGSSVVDLSGDFSLSDFDAVLGASPSMYCGVIGAESGNTADVFLTQLRSGGAGTPSTPGSDVTATMTRTEDDTVYNHLATLDGPSAGTGVLDPNKTWESLVDPANGTGTFQSNTGLNPDSAITNSSVLYEDLWMTANSAFTGGKPYTYLGYFTLDLTGTPKLTFTPKAAPAPLTPPVLSVISITGATVTLLLSNTVPTHTYQLQYTTNLSNPTWTDIGSAQLANTTTLTNTDGSATDPVRFYQVKAN